MNDEDGGYNMSKIPEIYGNTVGAPMLITSILL